MRSAGVHAGEPRSRDPPPPGGRCRQPLAPWPRSRCPLLLRAAPRRGRCHRGVRGPAPKGDRGLRHQHPGSAFSPQFMGQFHAPVLLHVHHHGRSLTFPEVGQVVPVQNTSRRPPRGWPHGSWSTPCAPAASPPCAETGPRRPSGQHVGGVRRPPGWWGRPTGPGFFGRGP